MATVRYSRKKISRETLRELPRRKGLTGAHLLHAQPQAGGPTEEQKIRGGDASVDRVLLIGGHDPAAVEAAAGELAPRGATIGVYRLAYCLTSRDKA